MTKKWEKIGNGKYSFSVDDNLISTMEIDVMSINTKAVVKMHNDEIIIMRTGFWKNTIEITNRNNKLLAKVYSEKWYANTLSVDCNDKKYKLIIRNNPLAEWAITDNKQDLIAYGLNTGNENGKVNIKIFSSEDNQDYLFDFLLWYLFVPIATENMGDEFSFTMLLTVIIFLFGLF